MKKKSLVQKRLVERSKVTGIDVNKLRTIYALERLVARLCSNPKLYNAFSFKGGFMLLKSHQTGRFTKDIDVLAQSISVDEVLGEVKEALQGKFDDEITFHEPTVEELEEQEPYGGVRLIFDFYIGDTPSKLDKLSKVNLDICFNDALIASPNELTLQTELITEPPVIWRTYSIEQQFAEKLETMVRRGPANSRAKDFYDLVVLYPRIDDKELLVSVIVTCFQQRQTVLPRSFLEFWDTQDKFFIESSWGSVTVMGGELSFEKCVGQLRKVFQGLDSVEYLADDRE